MLFRSLLNKRYIGTVKILSDIVKSAKKELIFKKKDKEFIECHAGTIEISEDGKLTSAWFGGDKEGASNVMIYYSTKSDKNWSKPIKLNDKWEGVAHWNPVLFYHNNLLNLYYKHGNRIQDWETVYSTSNDFGNTWEESKTLVEKDPVNRGPVKNKPILLSNGCICAPTSMQVYLDAPKPKEQCWDCFVDLSYDNGITWEKSMLVPLNHDNLKGKGLIQPTVWESTPGNVHMFMRSTEDKMYRSDSTDYGKTWCEAYPTNISNNNSGIDLVKLSSGDLVLVYNKARKGARTPLNVALSKDNGQTFEEIAVLESIEGQYMYPSVVCDKEENLHIIYTYNRRFMVYCKIILK